MLVALSACAEPVPTSAVVTSSDAPDAFMFDRGHGAPSHADGSTTLVLTGRTQLFFFPTDLPAGPRAYINSGRAELAIAPDGQEVLVSQSGTQEDICAALQ